MVPIRSKIRSKFARSHLDGSIDLFRETTIANRSSFKFLDSLSDTPYNNPLLFERCAQSSWLITLNLDRSPFHRSAAAARRPNFLCDGFDYRQWQVGCELVDHNNRFSAAVSRFST